MSEERPNWHRTWLDVADVVARRSLCVNSRVGVVVVSADNFVVATGYNGPPPAFHAMGRPCDKWCPRAMHGAGAGTQDFSACESLHAEQNALLRVSRTDMEGGTIFVTRLPCITCARSIAASGVSTLVFHDDGTENPERHDQVTKYLARLGVSIFQYPRQKE